MSSIDQRVVEAKFDNRQFEQGVRTTMSSLDNLKKGLNMDGATRGLSGLSSAATTVTNRFSAMRIAVTTAIATIAHQATIAAEQLVKSFTVGPLLDGLHEYETQLNSVQTILSNTQWEHKNLSDVNAALNQLNHYSDKTIYNFSEMARNVGTFTAAGVKLDTSVSAIKGIANLAAVSGSNSQQASTAMYQLSQAIASGTVKLMDWNSVVNAGMGGKVFQDALKETARVHGVDIDAMIKKEGSFRNTLQNGWLTSKILTQTLNNFTGDVSKKQLEQMGYTEKQIQGILKMGKTATDAATKVKTFTQLMGTLKEAAGSGWAKTWQIIIGNFNQAKELWTNVSNVLGGAIQNSAKARNNMLKDWAAFGGRKAMIEGISNAFKALMSVLTPIKDAFREVFPATTGKQLAEMTKSFRDFMANLKIGAETADNLKRTFAGVFAVLDIGWQVIKAGIHFIADLFGAITKGEGSGGFLGATANIGDFLVALDQAIKKGQGLTKFFDGLMHILAGPIQLLKALAHALFSVFDFGPSSSDGITKSIAPISNLGEGIVRVFDKLYSVLGRVFSFATRIGHAIATAFSGVGEALTGAFVNINYEAVLHTINTALLGGLVLLIKKFVDHFKSGDANPVKGFVDAIKEPFGELTNTMKEMQNTLRATTLLQIAAAIGIITLSVIGLSKVDAAGLTRALTAISVMFGQLFGSLVVFEKIGGAEGLASTAAGLILFATAIRILTSSVRSLAELSWNDLAKGLVGVTVLIGGLTAAVRGMSGASGGMLRAGASLILLATGIKILASAVGDLAELSWGQMSKGLVGVGALLTSLAIFSKFAETNKSGVLAGAGLVLLATGIKILASAVADFADIAWGGIAKGLVSITAILEIFSTFSETVGNPVTLLASSAALIGIGIAMNILAKAMDSFAKLSWGQIAKGLVSMAGALLLISDAMNAMPATSVLSAAALVGVSIALQLIAKALGTMGGMSWGEIAKGLVTLAVALAIIADAVELMTGALSGAAAIFVVAAALRLLAPVLLAFGQMSWTEIAKGLIMLAGAFAVIGLAAVALAETIPAILGLAGAIALLGVGVLAIGAGVFLFAAGLTALAAAGGAAVGAIVGIVKGLIDLLPMVARALGKAIVAFAEAISHAGPAVLKAIQAVLDALVKAVNKEAPKIIAAAVKLMIELVDAVAKAVPKMADAGLRLILGVLKAIAKEAPKIVNEIAQILINILKAMAARLPDIVTAGVDVMVAFIHGVSKNIGRVISAGTDLLISFLKGVGKNGVKIVNAALDVIIKFVNGVAKAINDHVDEFRNAGKNIAFAIANGMTLGLASKAASVAKGAVGVAKGAVGAVGGWLGIHSPSKKFHEIGMWCAIGMANGLTEYSYVVRGAAADVAKGAAFEMYKASKEFRDAANFIAKDFYKGLVGGKDEIVQTLSDAKGALHDIIASSRSDIKDLKNSLKDLRKTRKDANEEIDKENAKIDRLNAKMVELQKNQKKNKDEIKSTQTAIDTATHSRNQAIRVRDKTNAAITRTIDKLGYARNEYHLSNKAFDELTEKLDHQKEHLKNLGKEYDHVRAKLQQANQDLQDAIRIRDDYNKSIAEQYKAGPDFTAETDLGDFETQSLDYLANLKLFISALNTLRAEGLNDDMYKTLLGKGVDVLPFVNQIVAGGQTAVDELNNIDSDLSTTAQGLGDTASTELYQAGVDAAQGIVDGLKEKEQDIKDEMERIADVIVKAISDALGLPYTKHHKGDGKGKGKGKGRGKGGNSSTHNAGHAAGADLVAGLGDAIANSDITPKLSKLSKNVGDSLTATIKQYVADINKSLGKDINTNPTIVPVLDLSELDKKASQIPGILNSHSLSTTQAQISANDISRLSSNQDSYDEKISRDPSPARLTFIQNNNSPKALSTSEIYRNTKNQISIAKGALV